MTTRRTGGVGEGTFNRKIACFVLWRVLVGVSGVVKPVVLNQSATFRVSRDELEKETGLFR